MRYLVTAAIFPLGMIAVIAIIVLFAFLDPGAGLDRHRDRRHRRRRLPAPPSRVDARDRVIV